MSGLTGKITVSDHFRKQMNVKGFTTDQVIGALKNPSKVTNVSRYPGQKRYCGQGVAVVVAPGNRLVTVYQDGVVTPLRPDQMNDLEALRSRRLNG